MAIESGSKTFEINPVTTFYSNKFDFSIRKKGHDGLKEIYNKFRTHVRKNYPEEYKKVQEASTTGTGASFTPGVSMAYATPYAFGDNKRKKKKGYMGYKEI